MGTELPDLYKRSLRSRLLAERRALDPEEVDRASREIAARILALPEIADARAIALYQAMGNEISMEPLWRELVARGRQVLFPIVRPGTRVLAFSPARNPEDLSTGAFGIREPPAEWQIPLDQVEIFVVPALGFAPSGRRLGRGGGYYDATLAAAPQALRIGPCLESQLLDELPIEPHDEGVDVVVTPRRTLRTRRHG